MTFEQGELAGGAVLWSESSKDFQNRQRDGKVAGWFSFGMICVIVAVAFQSGVVALRANPPHPLVFLYFPVGIFFFILGVLLLGSFNKLTKSLTPFRVYENGCAIEVCSDPFLPRASLYSIDVQSARGRQTPHTAVVTWEGGYRLRITSSSNIAHIIPAAYMPDLDALLAALGKMEGVPKVRSDLWSEGAWKLTETLRLERGPARAIAEFLARRSGSVQIDARFLEENWNQIRRIYRPYYLPPFKRVSRKGPALMVGKKAREVRDPK